MRAISPIIEHVLLSAGALMFFILVVVSFNSVQTVMIKDDITNRLENMSNQVALAISQAILAGEKVEEMDPEQPVVQIRLDLPQSLAGYQYVVKYEDGNILARAKGEEASSDLLDIEKNLTIEGKITGSAVRKPTISYYRTKKLIILENAR